MRKANLRAPIWCAILFLTSLSPAARAQSFFNWTHASQGDALGLSLPADAILLGGAAVLWGGSQSLRNLVGPRACNLCEGVDNLGLPGEPGDGRGTLNGVDSFFHDALTGWAVSRKSADTFSSGIAYGAAPILGLSGAIFATGPHASDWAGARASVMVLESVAISGLLGQTIKFGLARKRPFIRYGHGTDGSTADEGRTYDVNDPDSHFSFISGHTSATAALTVSAAMCATLQDSKAAPYLWAGAGTLTFLAGTLRLIAEKHYFTDVVGGAVLGAGVGVLIPLLHKTGGLLGGDRDGSVQITAAGSKILFAWNGMF